MIIASHIQEINQGRIFSVVDVMESLKGEETYKALINGKVQYFRVLNPERKLYKSIVGYISNERPVLIQNIGYWCDLLEHNGLSLMAIGHRLERVVDKEELKVLHGRCCWSWKTWSNKKIMGK